MKILFLSAYHAHSHRLWCEQLMQQFPTFEWKLLTLNPRFFSWRIRGNSLLWKCFEEDALQDGYDLIIATSMTELSSLFGFFPHLSSIPSILYFHENQFAYPLSTNVRDSVEPKIVQLYSALSATSIVFNSEFNRHSFLSGVKNLLMKLPDKLPLSLVEQLENKSEILPVPVRNAFFIKSPERYDKFSIVWNHRWEYDKWPECFFKALCYLSEQGIPFDLYVFGQQYRQSPPVFSEMRLCLTEHIKHWGWAENEDEYKEQISRCHVAVSTALHDFQGLAMLEAAAAGLISVVPDRLAYPEWFGTDACYASFADDLDKQAIVLAEKLQTLYVHYSQGSIAASADVNHLSWESMRAAYLYLLKSL